MMYTVTRINVVSLARQFFFLSLIPCIAGLMFLFVFTPRPSQMNSIEWILVTLVGCVGLTVSLSIAIAICAGLVAMLFNLSVKFSGGVKIHFEPQENHQQGRSEKLKHLL